MSKPHNSDPELLKLLNSRASWNLPEHKKPHVNGEYLQRMNAAVDAYARANRSDPFARDRIALYLRQGYEFPSDILDESNGRMRSQAWQEST